MVIIRNAAINVYACSAVSILLGWNIRKVRAIINPRYIKQKVNHVTSTGSNVASKGSLNVKPGRASLYARNFAREKRIIIRRKRVINNLVLKFLLRRNGSQIGFISLSFLNYF